MIKVFNIIDFAKINSNILYYCDKIYSTKSLYLDRFQLNKISSFLKLYKNFNHQYINNFSCSTTNKLKIYLSIESFYKTNYIISKSLKIPNNLNFIISFNYQNFFTFFNIYYLDKNNNLKYKKAIMGYIEEKNDLNIIENINESIYVFFINNKDYLINEFFINLISSDIK